MHTGFGKNWHAGFLRCHSEIKSIKGRTIDYKRLNGATAELLNELFIRLKISEVAAIPPALRTNADEFGLIEGIRDNYLVLGKAYRKYILLKDLLKRK